MCMCLQKEKSIVYKTSIVVKQKVSVVIDSKYHMGITQQFGEVAGVEKKLCGMQK